MGKQDMCTKFAKEYAESFEEMSEKVSYICKNCGYVLSKKDAVVSGYDSQFRYIVESYHYLFSELVL